MSPDQPSADGDYKPELIQAVLDEPSFLRLTLSKKLRADGSPWIRIVVRPILVRGERMLQFSYFDSKKDTSRNFDAKAARKRLLEALDIPFGQIHLQATAGDVQVRISRKGRVHVTRMKPSLPSRSADLAHDHAKQYLLTPDNAGPVLQALGIATPEGRIHADLRAKYLQTNEFLRIIEGFLSPLRHNEHEAEPETRNQKPGTPSANSELETRNSELESGTGVPPVSEPQADHGRDGRATILSANSKFGTRNSELDIVDCGCGRAHLTFAAHYYLNDVRRIPARVVGIDSNPELIAKCLALRNSLGLDAIDFRVSEIASYQPPRPPDIVLSLHACDTATDEALALGVRWRSRVILAAPCCQHELHDQLKSDPLRAVLRHGILKARLADILTDTFRALALRIMGYRTTVIEFISPESTSKNLLIRAERGVRPGDPALVAEFRELKAFCGAAPAIERLLGEDFQALLNPT